MSKTRLTESELSSLKEIVERRSANLASHIKHDDTDRYTRQQKEEIKSLLLDELSENGLDENDEPTKLGLFIEDLIDKFKLQ